MTALIRRPAGVATPQGEAAPAGAPIVTAEGIVKSYGATRAIRDAGIELLPGEVHALVGENGSGKSSLVKILAGVQRPDAGVIRLHGVAVPGWRSPGGPTGIAAVFQEVLTVPARSVLDNVWLGSEGVFRAGAPLAVRRKQALAVLGRLIEDVPPLDTPVQALPLSQRQAVCIARALLRDPDLLILDEATSSLDVDTRDRLFAELRARAARGKSALFISHRMDEIEELADRVTVMRSGETVACRPRSADRADLLVELMSGDRLPSQPAPPPSGNATRIALSARGLRLAADAQPIDFEFRAGEIIGVAGLEGHGQSRFLKALAGLLPEAGEVGCHVDGDRKPITDPRAAARHGVAYVPRERRGEGLFESLSIADNFAVPTTSADRRWGLLSRRRAERRLAPYVESLRIRLGDTKAPIGTLSGGNQQKVILARWLSVAPSVLLLDDPTRGIDIGAKRDIYRMMNELSAQGTTVVMVSTDMDELLELMHRVMVFRENAVFRSYTRPELERDRLVGAFFGREER